MTLTKIRALAHTAGAAIGFHLTGAYIALAQFGGEIPEIEGTIDGDVNQEGIRNIILDALKFVLDFMALIAVVFIVVAGIRLIVSQGDEDAKNKAKTTILYVILGLLVILFARVIVGFFTSTISGELGA